MGLCFSKSDNPPTSASHTTATQRVPASQRSRTHPQESTKVLKKSRPEVTKNQQQSKPERIKAPKKSSPKKTGGQTVGGSIDGNKEKLSPQDAARLAAEKRFQESNQKSTKGKLGKKLAQERGKSSRAHVLQEVEKKEAERNNTPLIYD